MADYQLNQIQNDIDTLRQAGSRITAESWTETL